MECKMNNMRFCISSARVDEEWEDHFERMEENYHGIEGCIVLAGRGASDEHSGELFEILKHETKSDYCIITTRNIKTNKEFKAREYESFSRGYYDKLKSTHYKDVIKAFEFLKRFKK